MSHPGFGFKKFYSIFSIVIIFAVTTTCCLAEDIDTSKVGCGKYDGTGGGFIWTTGSGVSSNIRLTVPECGGGDGENGHAYAFTYLSMPYRDCNGGSSCGEDTCYGSCGCETFYEGLRAVIKVTGSQEGFEKYFPNGMKFIGDKQIPSGPNSWHWSYTMVKELGKQYELVLVGANPSVVSLDLTPKGGEYSQKAQFNISIIFYEKRSGIGSNPPCWSFLSRSSGSVTIEPNKRTDTNYQIMPFNPLNGEDGGSVQEIIRDYTGSQGEWGGTHRGTGMEQYCESVTSWLVNNQMVTTNGKTVYRVKYPGWEKEVNGCPGYMSNEGWSLSPNEDYIKLDNGDQGDIYFNVGGSGSTRKLYSIEHCDDEVARGSGTDKWLFHYDTAGNIKFVYSLDTDPNNPSQSSEYYDYDWSTPDAYGNVSADIAYYKGYSIVKSWYTEFDGEGRITKSNDGCSSCGDIGDFYHVKYYDSEDYPEFAGLIEKRFNANGDTVLWNVYEARDISNPPIEKELLIFNKSFEYPDVDPGEYETTLPSSWSFATGTGCVEVADPDPNSLDNIYVSGESVPDGEQFIRLSSGCVIEQELWEAVLPDTFYILEAEVGAYLNGSNRSASIKLIAVDEYDTETTIAHIDLDATELGLHDGQWKPHDDTGLDVDEYDVSHAGERLKLEISGNSVDIDNIRLLASTQLYEKTVPMLKQQKAQPVGGSVVTIADWTYDDDDNNFTAIEKRHTDDGYRVTKYQYADKTFSRIVSKTEYEDLDENPASPSGRSFTTEYSYRRFIEENVEKFEKTAKYASDRSDVEVLYKGHVIESFSYYGTDPNNLINENTYGYDSYDDTLNWHTDSRGATTNYDYYETSYGVDSYGYLLKEVKEPSFNGSQQIMQYTYDGGRRIKTEKKKDTDGNWVTTEYEYDENTGVLDSVTVDLNGSNHAITNYKYNDIGQVTWTESGEGVVSHKSYNAASQLECDYVQVDPNDISDGLIWQTRYYYDSNGRLEYTKKVKSNSIFQYGDPDDAGDTLDWIVTKNEYDYRGRLWKVTEDFGGADLTTTYEYNLQGEQGKVTYPTGRWVETIRDGRGQVIQVTEGYGTTDVLLTTYSFDNNGNLDSQENKDGTTELFYYDEWDRLEIRQSHNENGPYSEFGYDIGSQVNSQVYYQNPATILSETSKTYDLLGRVYQQRSHETPGYIDNTKDMVVEYKYDIAGNQIEMIRKDETLVDPNIVTTTNYDSLNRTHKSTDGEGFERYAYYNRDGQVTFAPDPNMFSSYDNYGRLEKTTDADGNYAVFSYNSLGQVYEEKVYDCNSTTIDLTDDYIVKQVRSEFDNLGRLERKAVMKDPTSTANISLAVDMVTDFVYNSATGLLDEVHTYANGSTTPNKTYFYYDGLGRKWRTVDPEGNETKIYFYATNNAQVEKEERIEVDPDNSSNNYTIITLFEYDDFGRLWKRILDVDVSGTNNAGDYTTEYYYDGLGRLVEQVAPDGIKTFYGYDYFGNRNIVTEDPDEDSYTGANRITEYSFDRLDRQTTITAYDPNEQTTVYNYNKNDQPIMITYPDSKTAEYIYNRLGKVTQETQRNATDIYYAYDLRGNMLWESDNSEGVFGFADPNETIPITIADYGNTFEYNAGGQITYTSAARNYEVISDSIFEYNGFGLADSDNTILYTADDVQTDYTYDQSGNILSRTHGDETISYSYDGLGRIDTITKDSQQIAQYKYIGSSTKSIEYPQAEVKETRDYDELGRVGQIKSIETFVDGETILDYIYSYDSLSNRKSVKYNHLTVPVWDKYYYEDNLRRLTKVDYSATSGFATLDDVEGKLFFAVKIAERWLEDDFVMSTAVNYELARLDVEKTKQMTFDAILNNISLNDMPVLTLAEFGEEDIDTEPKTTTQILTNDDGDIIAEIVSDLLGRILLFTMYPDIGGKVTVLSVYDTDGSLKSNLFVTFDDEDNIIDSEKLTAEPVSTTDTLAESSLTAEPMSMTASSSGMMMSMGEPTAPTAKTDEYGYSPLGNRTTVYNDKGSMAQETLTYDRNDFNQYDSYTSSILSMPTTTYITHDDNGNIESDGEYSYTYDQKNRLSSVDSQFSFDYDSLGRRISKTDSADVTILCYYDTAGRVIAEYIGTEIAGYDIDRTFVYGNGYSEVLAMFIAEDELDQTGFDTFLEFVDTWLCVDPNDACYDATYDDNDDDIVDYADFAAFADDFDIPTGKETNYYYLKDALGSVVGLVGGKYDRPEDREFYNYDIYGQPVLPNEQESQSQNPYQFAGMRFDVETGTYHTLHRTYNSQLGRWLQLDPWGYVDGMSLYEYVASNPTNYIDPSGTNLYALGGTCESHADGYNTERVYRYFESDGGPLVGKGKYFYDGVGTKKHKPHWFKPINTFRKMRNWDENLNNQITGKEATEIVEKVKKQICKDYCKDNNMKINLVGWSRGAASALEIAKLLEEEGCCNNGGKVKIKVNWLGLFDAVEMTTNSRMAEDVASNVERADHARRTQRFKGKQKIFPRVSGKAESPNTTLTSKDFFFPDGSKTTHNDIGTQTPYLRWMMRQAEKAGLKFDWNHFDRDNKRNENKGN